MKPEELASRACVPCRGGTPPLSADSAKKYLKAVPRWSLAEGDGRIARRFEFRDFVQAMEFVNRVAGLAEAQGHHPDIAIHWNKVDLELWTHAIGGLHENDFIRAYQRETGSDELADLDTRRNTFGTVFFGSLAGLGLAACIGGGASGSGEGTMIGCAVGGAMFLGFGIPFVIKLAGPDGSRTDQPVEPSRGQCLPGHDLDDEALRRRRHDVGRRARGHDAPVIDQHDAVAELGCFRHVMGAVENRGAGGRFSSQRVDDSRIHRGGKRCVDGVARGEVSSGGDARAGRGRDQQLVQELGEHRQDCIIGA